MSDDKTTDASKTELTEDDLDTVHGGGIAIQSYKVVLADLDGIDDKGSLEKSTTLKR